MMSRHRRLATVAGHSPRDRGRRLRVAKGPRRWQRRQGRTFYVFVAPWVIGFVILTLAPIIYAFGVSLTNYDGSSSFWRFIGFRNYVEFFTKDTDGWASLLRTLGYAAIVVPLSVAGGLVPGNPRQPADPGTWCVAGAVLPAVGRARRGHRHHLPTDLQSWTPGSSAD